MRPAATSAPTGKERNGQVDSISYLQYLRSERFKVFDDVLVANNSSIHEETGCNIMCPLRSKQHKDRTSPHRQFFVLYTLTSPSDGSLKSGSICWGARRGAELPTASTAPSALNDNDATGLPLAVWSTQTWS